MAHAPGAIRDGIVDYLEALDRDASINEISEALALKLGTVPPSSVRSYLNLNAQTLFERTGMGRYKLRSVQDGNVYRVGLEPAVEVGRAKLYHADCFDWLAEQEPNSIHAVVTDPPYGVVEYTDKEIAKLRAGKGGVWRVPPRSTDTSGRRCPASPP